MKSSESQPMEGEVYVDEFVVGGKEKITNQVEATIVRRKMLFVHFN
jgi:hypothetical protein